MKVFAPTAFRYPPVTGKDYPYGWQDIPQALTDTLLAAQLVLSDAPSPADALTANEIAGLAGGGGTDVSGAPVVTTIADITTSTVAIVESATTKQITCEDLIAELGETVASLTDAGTLQGADVITITRGGVDYSTTLTALASLMGSGIPSAPGQVTGLAAGSPGSTSMPLTWTAPSTGGTPTDYIVEWRASGGTWATFADGTSTSTGATVTGLTASTAYDFRVSATNATGTGTVSASVTQTTAASGVAPGQVLGLTTGTATSTTMPLTWSLPATGDAPTDYIVEWRLSGGTWATFADGTSTTLGATVTGLTAATAYDFRVSAVNATGTGPVSATATQTTAATSYSITGYSGNAVNANISASGSTVYGSLKLIDLAAQSTNIYWNMSPTPASARSGWSTSDTVPPADCTAGANLNGASSINGMVPMTHPGAWANESRLWVTNGSGTTTWYFWVKPVDGAAQCLNPSGTSVTGA